MKKISFNGKEYVRASEVAKKFRYTQDYVGQLCRNKKVDARRVGRNWYVTLDSVTVYRKSKHHSQKTASSTQKKSSSSNKSRVGTMSSRATKRVEPVLRSKTVRNTRQSSKQPKSKGVSYGSDSETLLPILTSTVDAAAQDSSTEKSNSATEKKSPRVQITRTPAVSLKVSSPKTETSFSSEKLPEISLSGKLSVAYSDEEIPTDFYESTDDSEEGDSVQVNDNQVEESVDSYEQEEMFEDGYYEEYDLEEEVDVPEEDNDDEVEDKFVKGVSFTPETVATSASKAGSMYVGIALSSAALIAMLLLGLGSELTISDDDTSRGWSYDIAAVARSLF